ncbi:ACOT3 thioesterase, partial [Amia calva]|nr:ACOT3 thioesterase [Amia calva]
MAGKGSCPLITIQPSRGLIDEKFQITVKNLLPGQAVTLHSLTQSEDSDFWEAFGHYVSDGKGTVKVAEDVSLGGSYDGLEPMGLLWSMKPAPGNKPGLRFRKTDVCTPVVVRIAVYTGHIGDGFTEASALARAVTERSYMAPGVRRTDIRQSGVRGTLFVPPGPGPFPAVLDLWGSGGLVEYRSALLASHGYVSLALDYYSTQVIAKSPDKNPSLGYEYFETAFTILQDHPQVASDQVALLALCFGTAVALRVAAYSAVINPRCVVCISASHVQPVNEPISSIEAEMQKNSDKFRFDENNRLITRDMFLPIPTDPSKKVDMGRIKYPLLLIFGEDDQSWPTAESAEDMEKMMEAAGNRHLLTTLSYPGAGHLIEPPYSPHARFSNFMVAQIKRNIIVLWGGETKLHCYAQEDSWQKILAFLDQQLYHSPGTSSHL